MIFPLSLSCSRSQGSLSRLDQDGPDGESTLSKMDIVLSFTLEVSLFLIYFHSFFFFVDKFDHYLSMSFAATFEKFLMDGLVLSAGSAFMLNQIFLRLIGLLFFFFAFTFVSSWSSFLLVSLFLLGFFSLFLFAPSPTAKSRVLVSVCTRARDGLGPRHKEDWSIETEPERKVGFLVLPSIFRLVVFLLFSDSFLLVSSAPDREQ